MMTKKKFLNQLAIRLSLILPFNEVESIIEDYNDWIENEITDNTNENDVCNKLKISDIIYENKQNYTLSLFKKLSLFVSNPSLFTLLCFIVSCLLQCFITDLVSSNILISTVTTLIINLIFWCCCKNKTKNINHNYNHKKLHIIIACIYLCTIIFSLILIYYLQFIITGKAFYYFFLLIGLSAFILTLYIILSNWININQVLSQIIFLNGIISLTFYYIGQLHNMYVNISDIIEFLICTTIIIVEILLLSFLNISTQTNTSTAKTNFLN